MKRIVFILLLSIAFCQLPIANCQSPSYTDDAYYWPKQADTLVSAEPVYDRNIREFIFLEDTAQRSDTVRMRIIER
jgi:hypothetical protein